MESANPLFPLLIILSRYVIKYCIEALGDQIDGLRAERQSILAEAAERSDLQERMNDMIRFLDEMPTMLTEYSDTITRRLVEKITIFDEKIVVELKSGLQMEVEE